MRRGKEGGKIDGSLGIKTNFVLITLIFIIPNNKLNRKANVGPKD